MEELTKLLKRKWGFCPAPVGSDHDWLILRWYFAFEPHGRASETWEEVWEIVLPGIRAHWKHLRDGWVPCTSDGPAHFKAHSLPMAIARTKAFLNEANADAERAKL